MSVATLPFIDLNAQYRLYQGEIDAAVSRVLSSGGFIQGPEVASLETELAAFANSTHCISCSSGTDALLIALMALGIGGGDEVITPAFTFFATAEVVSLLGARPVFADILPGTYSIDPKRIAERISTRTRAIIAVGLYGQPADMEEIQEIADAHGLCVIEDACQSFGAPYRGGRSGALARIGCTSFYPAKPLGCYGDGGAIFTSDDGLAAIMRQIMNHGQNGGYRHARIGLNGRLDTIQAAILRVKLRHYDEELAARQRVAARYLTGLQGVPSMQIPAILPDRQSVYAQYTISVPNRDALRAFLADAGVPTAVHYPLPLYRQEAYRDLLPEYEDPVTLCPVTEQAARCVVSLPFGPFLAEEQQYHIIELIKKFIKESVV